MLVDNAVRRRVGTKTWRWCRGSERESDTETSRRAFLGNGPFFRQQKCSPALWMEPCTALRRLHVRQF